MVKNDKIKKSEGTPAPQPERAIYGFFLLSFAIISFIIYIIISFVPSACLNQFGWDYLPDKYWSIAIPTYIVVIVLMVVPVYISLNIGKTNNPNSLDNIIDEYTLANSNKTKSISSIDPVYDIPISDVCQFLYLNKK